MEVRGLPHVVYDCSCLIRLMGVCKRVRAEPFVRSVAIATRPGSQVTPTFFCLRGAILYPSVFLLTARDGRCPTSRKPEAGTATGKRARSGSTILA